MFKFQSRHLILVFSSIAAALAGFGEAQAKTSRKNVRSPAATIMSEVNGIQDSVSNVGTIDDLRNALYRQIKPRRVLAQLRKASDLLRSQKYDPALRAASVVRSDPDFGDHARWLSAEALIFQAQDDLIAKRFDKARSEAREAVSMLSPISAEFPYSPLNHWVPRAMGRAELMMGQAACQAKKWSDCRKQYESGLERLSNVDALVYVRPADVQAYAEACSHHGPELCRAWVQRLASVHPHNSPEYKALETKLPDFIDDLPHGSSYGRITVPYHAPDSDTTAFDDAMGKYLDHKDKDAIQAFRQFLDEFPRSYSRFRAKYWLAQAMMHQKKDADAKKLLLELQQSTALSYYGLLAAIAANTDFEAPIKAASPIAQDYDPMLSAADLVRLRRAQALVSQKIYESAALELRDLRAHEGESNPFLVYLAWIQSEAGAHSSAFPVLNEIIARGDNSVYTQAGLKMVFPSERFDEIKKVSREFDIDAILVLSLMKQESAFDANAMSNTGALGLMQLMPGTASELVTDLARAELVTPETNMRTGMKYLSQLLRRYNGNIVFALAAYNSGPGAVNRWIKAQPQRHDMLEFIESIPYKETREYVSSIIRNYFWYSRRLGVEPGRPVTLAHFWGEVSGTIGMAPPPGGEVEPEPSGKPAPHLVPEESTGEIFGPALPDATPSEGPSNGNSAQFGPPVDPPVNAKASSVPHAFPSPAPDIADPRTGKVPTLPAAAPSP